MTIICGVALGAFDTLLDSSLTLKLTPVSIRELIYIDHAPCDLYVIEETGIEKILEESDEVNSTVIKELIADGHSKLYVYKEDRQAIIEYQQSNLRKLTMSLSIGDPFENGKKHLNLLTINMSYLYLNPNNDETLQLQYKSVQNLCKFLIQNEEIHTKLYKDYAKAKHHFIFSQPMLSSIFLLGVLSHSQALSKKEIENLFVTSYFKDIGMSVIPTEKYNKKTLDDEDKQLFANHPERSVTILQDRIPLGQKHFNIILNHHSVSFLSQEMSFSDDDQTQVLVGFETIIVCVMDIISAMISERPYRKSNTLYEALDFIKSLISHDYPGEFKLIVNYFRRFF